VGDRLDAWAGRAREQSQEDFIAGVRAEIRAGARPDACPAYEQAAPPEQLYAGLTRYWDKRAERRSPSRD